ncbi:MAG TPA: DUF1330 domain-containing protein [Polyangiaceae bacterium]|nr:DUF1330 domain-containing protein [Polyangiaceae bacterium]
MVAEADKFTQLMGLEVKDPARYAEYRARMTPILHAYGGAFGIDLEVSRVLKGPPEAASNPGVNRVFSIEFPSRATRDRFFADVAYRAVRSEWFEPAVGRVVTLAQWLGAGPGP